MFGLRHLTGEEREKVARYLVDKKVSIRRTHFFGCRSDYEYLIQLINYIAELEAKKEPLLDKLIRRIFGVRYL